MKKPDDSWDSMLAQPKFSKVSAQLEVDKTAEGLQREQEHLEVDTTAQGLQHYNDGHVPASVAVAREEDTSTASSTYEHANIILIKKLFRLALTQMKKRSWISLESTAHALGSGRLRHSRVFRCLLSY